MGSDLDVRLCDVDVSSIQAWHRSARDAWEAIVTCFDRTNEIERGIQYVSYRGEGPTLGEAILAALRARELSRNLAPA